MTVLRHQQQQLLSAVLETLRERPSTVPAWSLDEVRLVGLATGLTALGADLGVFSACAADVQHYLDEQVGQVRERVHRFLELLPEMMRALNEAAVPAVAVKGAALLRGVWARPDTRPMADIDLIVPPHLRAQAAATLISAGLRPLSSSVSEDTFLAWGDGGVGRTDGESAAHNGRVEVHPGWVEFLHGYTAQGFAVEQLPFQREELVTHVIGHLASTVVRAEVRAVNVVDVFWCAQMLPDWARVARLMADTDPRLTGPGLWLLARTLPDLVPQELVTQQLERLGGPARRILAGITPADVLRDPTQRTTLGWRQAFARTSRERVAVLDQMLWPQGPRSIRGVARRVAAR